MKTREEIHIGLVNRSPDFGRMADYVLSLLAEQRETDAKIVAPCCHKCAAAIRKGGTT